MSLNIKNERVSQLAVTLAERTGESITDAVGNAIEEKLEKLHRLDNQRSRKGLASKLRSISEEIRANAPPEWLSKTQQEFDEELYDELGLPR